MNTTTNTERPKLKLNFGKKPLTLATNANPAVAGPAPKKVAVFEKPEANDIATTKVGKVGIKTEVSSGMAPQMLLKQKHRCRK